MRKVVELAVRLASCSLFASSVAVNWRSTSFVPGFAGAGLRGDR